MEKNLRRKKKDISPEETEEKKMNQRNENNKEAKKRLKQIFPNVHVKGGTGTAYGWTKVYITLPRPENCECLPTGFYCKLCRDTWSKTYERVLRELTGIPFYGYYDDTGGENKKVSVHISFEEKDNRDKVDDKEDNF